MQYKLLKEDNDRIRSNIYRRYSMVRCLALVEACRIVKYNMLSGSPETTMHQLRSLVRKCQDDCADDLQGPNNLYKQTFKMENRRGNY